MQAPRAPWALALLCVAVTTAVAAWQPAPAPLFTRWAAEVSPTNALPEYPRPQLVRSNWLNLNGLWDYAVTPLIAAPPSAYEGQILVPFPVESALSGVGRRLSETNLLWYRRSFTVPPAWAGQRMRLHFGAADWETRVFVNGQFAGQHRGGYDAFSFDLTPLLRAGDAPQELVVSVWDPTEGDQPRGKQSRRPEGIFYTATSGLWQTVWLEPVPAVCVETLTLTPDLAANTLRLRAEVSRLDPSLLVEAVASADGREVARVTGPANAELKLALGTARRWSPEDPFLYDLQVMLRAGDRTLDRVDSYFGMRQVSLHKDTNSVARLALNGEVRFQLGTLDQGFWPDGIYTAPTDAALRSDIEAVKQAGFNLIRKHVKVEPARWYYWCDRLGMLVWQDMPSGNNGTPAARVQFEAELQRLIAGLQPHPSVVLWVLFNEGWGQYDTERLTAWVKRLDPARLVSNASGWTDQRVGDVLDLHSYPGPEAPVPTAERAAVLGEFGGLGLGVPGHTWSREAWGYQSMGDVDKLAARYAWLLSRLDALRQTGGLSAAVYTQTTDVETECNGLLTYDRAVSKLAPETLRAANRSVDRVGEWRVILPNARHGQPRWRYTTEPPAAEWFRPEFDARDWREGPGGFGTDNTPGAVVRTVWDTTDLWLRREFTLATTDVPDLAWQLHHDEDAEVYLNGVLVARTSGHVTDYYPLSLSPAALRALRVGVNVLAVHCRQTSGGQFIDVGLVAPPPPPSAVGP